MATQGSESPFPIWNALFRAQCGRVTMLINNAGILPARPFLDFSDGETIRKIFEVNTYSQVRTPWPFSAKYLQKSNESHLILHWYFAVLDHL